MLSGQDRQRSCNAKACIFIFRIICSWKNIHPAVSDPFLRKGGMRTAICKIDCLSSNDESVYKNLNIPTVTGLSRDICPDHFLVSNLPELWDWCDCLGRDCLLIETAGLCHRCSPADRTLYRGMCPGLHRQQPLPLERLGPMVSGADFIILTKIDMVSQAELEIIEWQLKKLNPGARIFPADGLRRIRDRIFRELAFGAAGN